VTVFLRENPTIETSGDTTVFAGTAPTLHATGAESFTWEPSGKLDCPTCADPVFPADTTTTFQVTGTSEFGCESIDSLTVTVLPAPVFQSPNIFTPNSDGVNDSFNPVFQGDIFQQFRLRIFIRWGDLVFETSDPDTGWNGEQDGEPAPSDVYVYVLNYRLINEMEGTESGDVTLAR
ncbi:MAG: gliding motility-associated C-terminal domain-containing protein, partial [Bacteroidota bacterium]